MATTSAPITTEAFALAIESLDVPLLHRELSRLQNSIFHLERTNVALESEDDEELREIILENRGVIERQEERISVLRIEIEKRTGRGDVCGDAGEVVGNGDRREVVEGQTEDGAAVNGDVTGNEGGSRTVEVEVRQNGGSANGDTASRSSTSPQVGSEAQSRSAAGPTSQASTAPAANAAEQEEEVGVYL